MAARELRCKSRDGEFVTSYTRVVAAVVRCLVAARR